MHVRRPAVAVLAAAALSLPLLGAVPGPVTAAPPTGVSAELTTDPAGEALVARRGRVTVPVGSTFLLRGKAAGGKRTVTLREKKGRKLRKVARTRTTKRGEYTFRVRAGNRVRTRTFVATAPRTRGAKAYRSALKVRVVRRSGGPVPPTAPPQPPGTPVPPTPAPPPPPPPPTPTGVGATWDRPQVAAYAAATVVSGAVTGVPGGRTVVVQGQFGNDWLPLAGGTSLADGSFAIPLPTDFLRSTSTRVVVEATATASAAVSPVASTSVVPHYTPSGADPNNWRPIDETVRLRFNSCEPVRYRVNYTHAPAYARASVAEAVRHLRFATGLSFVDAGDTDAHSWAVSGAPGIDYATTDLLISFGGQQHTTADMSGNVLARGGPSRGWNASDAQGGHVQIDGSQVFVDYLTPGTGITWEPSMMTRVLYHEVGHALGLGHAGGEDQIMSPTFREGVTPQYFGRGDLTGLATLGMQYGCSRLPARDGDTPRVVELDLALP
jgi:hypothetical protein